ncbi:MULTISPECIES: flagellar basal body L-ring protein FlgH [Uliginosibacterium]|jgi:flagellar L-ring protein precursor FlgH|uniref:Flagellar L-ring protein n=1 Tax=Uliginosibacterium aquaticum TaxID=2731212 RepID=A0ABX2IFS3_9RHOO|nr:MULTISPECIES: flagellar basal body L-ring protein FlgH [Uliginosibacterium]MDO6384753.1 flagellar basal body L-ring protein FlgH [Uliginosibacterium sp. 31-12]NSL55533.1 flagellar basal body L-ring protein FlgH [Uliginosibacterium aquaticum]PLK48445.1 flagellar biosynthesis protein FlgH [Uliginosibacterium sp. TH139]
MSIRLVLLLLVGLLSGCSLLQQTTAVHQPMTARPMPARTETAGSIFGSSPRSLFEDRRARYVGDTLTINIVEKNAASKSSNTNATRASSTEMEAPLIAGVMGKNIAAKMSASAAADQSFAGKGTAAANNSFTGTVTVTVIEVFPNGNLLVSGEKQVAINQGQEFIRFSGVVNQNNVSSSNTVQSTQVADARLEYKANGYLDEAQTMGWMQRIFMNVLPF